MRRPIRLLLSLSLAVAALPAVAQPPAILTQHPLMTQQPFMVAINVDELEEELAAAEQKLKAVKHDEESIKALGYAVQEVAKIVGKAEAGEVDKAVMARVMALRVAAAKAGADIGNWENYWNYDGKELGDKKKFVEAVEQQLYQGYYAISESRETESQEAVDKLKGILAKDAFKTDDTLKHYVETFAAPRLVGLIRLNGLYRAAMIQNRYRWTLDAIAQNDVDGTQLQAGQCQESYRKMKGDGFDTAAFKISTNTSDPLADEITLDEAMKQIDAAMAKSKVLAAKAKAEHEAYLKSWKDTMKADKARLYAEMGIPHRFQNWIPKMLAADAAKSPWWFYFDRQDRYYVWEVTYKFDASHKLIDTQKRLTLSPSF